VKDIEVQPVSSYASFALATASAFDFYGANGWAVLPTDDSGDCACDTVCLQLVEK
jgi:hypothetical protein